MAFGTMIGTMIVYCETVLDCPQKFGLDQEMLRSI
jgi:hypothetical protein